MNKRVWLILPLLSASLRVCGSLPSARADEPPAPAGTTVTAPASATPPDVPPPSPAPSVPQTVVAPPTGPIAPTAPLVLPAIPGDTGHFEFGSYGRVVGALDARGGTGRDANIVAH